MLFMRYLKSNQLQIGSDEKKLYLFVANVHKVLFIDQCTFYVHFVGTVNWTNPNSQTFSGDIGIEAITNLIKI